MDFLFLLLSFYLNFESILSENKPLILSEYILKNRLTEAKSLSEVKGLPNAPQITSYSGFLTVDYRYNSNLFFWFFPSTNNSRIAPVVIWLEGGPGASSLWTLFDPNGPLKVDQHMNVSLNPYSWTQELSMLYIDNPIGAGFSFTDDPKGYSTDQNSIADNLYVFLQQFYQIFSEYRSNELYIAGESYGGKYVPSIGHKLMKMSESAMINFKGIAIGNGLTDPINQFDGFNHLKTIGLIDEKQQNELKNVQERIKAFYYNNDYFNASKLFMNPYFVNESDESLFQRTGFKSYYNSLYSNFSYNDNIDFVKYLNMSETRDAIHVGTLPYYLENDIVYQNLASDIIQSVFHNLTELIPHYRVLLFVGNLDMLLGPSQVSAMLENKEWKYYNSFYHAKRVIWKVSKNDKEVAGYAKSFDNFTMVIVRNAGHSVRTDQPRSNLDLIKRFVYNLSFDTFVY